MAASTGNTRGHCYIILCVGLVLLPLRFVDADEASTTTEIPKRVLQGIKSLTAESESGLNENSLPMNVQPIHYYLKLFPRFNGFDPENFTFTGMVTIQVKCEIESREITLHSQELSVDRALATFYPDNAQHSNEFKVDLIQEEDSPYLKIILSSKMKVGHLYWINLHFRGLLRDDNKGFYYKQYNTDTGPAYLVATRFMPTYARTVFPCFDEPSLKASFTLTLVKPKGFEARTNTALNRGVRINEFKENGMKYDQLQFRKSAVMSTFALGVFIGKAYLATISEHHDFKHACVIPKGVKSQANYALESKETLTEQFENYFEIPYRYRKSEMVVIPGGENVLHWGIDFFRDTYIMEHSKPVEHEKANLDMLMAHSIAHAYFGNLVNPLWWNDAWLVEGLSSYHQYLAAKLINSQWRMWDQFIFDKVQTAFILDDLAHGKPVIRRVTSEPDIVGMFDWLIDTKAPVLIRMMNFIVGEDVFKKAINKYLLKWSLNITTTKDLYNELEKESKAEGSSLNVSEIMDTWFRQPNYPLVTVTRDFHNHSLIRVEQHRFLTETVTGQFDLHGFSTFPYRWTIPLTFLTSVSPNAPVTNKDIYWLDKSEAYKEFTISNGLSQCSDPEGWILLNVNQQGYYRVNYQTGNWLALSKQLKKNHNVIPVINRAQIMNDAWALTRARKYIPLNIALETLDYLDTERDFLPWQTATTEFKYLESRFSYTAVYGGMKIFMREKLGTPFRDMLKKDLTISTYSLLKVAEQACYYDIKECTEIAVTRYNQLMAFPERDRIEPHIRQMINCIAIANGDWKQFILAVRFFNIAESDEKKKDFLYAMACTRKPWIINVLLGMLLDDQVVISPENALHLLSWVIKNPYGRYLAWDYYRTNYAELADKYSTLSCANALPVITELFNTKLELTEVILFSIKECMTPLEGESKKPIDTIIGNIQWTRDNSPIIKAWLENNNYLIH